MANSSLELFCETFRPNVDDLPEHYFIRRHNGADYSPGPQYLLYIQAKVGPEHFQPLVTVVTRCDPR